jgi:hypothetical protein
VPADGIERGDLEGQYALGDIPADHAIVVTRFRRDPSGVAFRCVAGRRVIARVMVGHVVVRMTIRARDVWVRVVSMRVAVQQTLSQTGRQIGGQQQPRGGRSLTTMEHGNGPTRKRFSTTLMARDRAGQQTAGSFPPSRWVMSTRPETH